MRIIETEKIMFEHTAYKTQHIKYYRQHLRDARDTLTEIIDEIEEEGLIITREEIMEKFSKKIELNNLIKE